MLRMPRVVAWDTHRMGAEGETFPVEAPPV